VVADRKQDGGGGKDHTEGSEDERFEFHMEWFVDGFDVPFLGHFLFLSRW
jgi:hypothetical protein